MSITRTAHDMQQGAGQLGHDSVPVRCILIQGDHSSSAYHVHAHMNVWLHSNILTHAYIVRHDTTSRFIMMNTRGFIASVCTIFLQFPYHIIVYYIIFVCFLSFLTTAWY